MHRLVSNIRSSFWLGAVSIPFTIEGAAAAGTCVPLPEDAGAAEAGAADAVVAEAGEAGVAIPDTGFGTSADKSNPRAARLDSFARRSAAIDVRPSPHARRSFATSAN